MAKFKTYNQFLNEDAIPDGLASHFYYLSDTEGIIFNAVFALDSPVSGILPGIKNGGLSAAFDILPKNVVDVGYIGEGEGIAWEIEFEKGITFEEAWQSLRDANIQFTGLDAVEDFEPYFISVKELEGEGKNLRGTYVSAKTGIL